MLGKLYPTIIQVLILVHSIHEEESRNKRVVISFLFVCLPISLRNFECSMIKFALRLYAIILLAQFVLVRMPLDCLSLFTQRFVLQYIPTHTVFM